MRILGITDGQTSGATIVEDGRILAAINEERIARIKLARGFPWESIREVMRMTGTEPGDIGHVAVAQVNMELHEDVLPWPGWFEARGEDGDVSTAFFKMASRFGGIAPRIPGLKKAYYSLRSPVYAQRRKRIAEILRDEYSIAAKPRFISHHYAHATSAYYTSQYEDALVVTMDGGGDGHSSHVYSVEKGHFRKLNTADSYDSLGNYYAYVTALCGYKAKRHEGKITGLAATGKPLFRSLLAGMIACRDGHLHNDGRVLFNKALDRIRSQLPDGWTHADLAASVQQVAEDVATAYVAYWAAKTGHRNVALAGGLFANVRINEEIQRLPGVDNVFVHPAMSDEGLAVGAALAQQGAIWRQSGGEYQPRDLPDVYLGNGYTEREIAAALDDSGLEFQAFPGAVEGEIARRLAQGDVVARFAGRMEYGPRALGNRSILYQPGDPSVNDWLNDMLKRTEFMPFAPASRWESARDLYEIDGGSLDTARFMTITYHCRPVMRDKCGGVVHVDNTARPQLVREQDNPSYYRIIREFEALTNLPAIINTSFNIHEEPIVRSPQDALRAFLDSSLDWLALGDFLVKGPVGSQATRDKWQAMPRESRMTAS
jgi:carbamoyltransferase